MHNAISETLLGVCIADIMQGNLLDSILRGKFVFFDVSIVIIRSYLILILLFVNESFIQGYKVCCQDQGGKRYLNYIYYTKPS